MTLEKFIYEFNLVSTLTVKDTDEWVYVLNNRIDKEIDCSNSINFYHLVESFNKLYWLFKKEYECLKKLDLGEYEEILKFDKWESEGSSYRRLIIYVDNPKRDICDDYDTLLYLYERDGEVYNYVTNGLFPWDEGYYKKELKLDNQLVKSYLDFGDRYGILIDSYNFLKNKCIFGNSTTSLFSKINGNLLEELSTFELAFGNNFFNTSDYVKVVFKLGEFLEIDYNQSEVLLRTKKIENKKEIIDELIYNLFINRTKLSKMYVDSCEKRLVNVKK